MTAISDVLHGAVHRGRRLRGRVQLRSADVHGATATTVLAAVRLAGARRPSGQEREWLDRIERLRRSLAASDQPLALVDFGATRDTPAQVEQVDQPRETTRTLGQMTLSSKQPEWAYLLFRLVRALQPSTCLELGSCVGISAAYQAAALALNGGPGRLLTLEGSDVLAARSALTLQDLGLAGRADVRVGPFRSTLAPGLRDLRPLEFAFVDGHHDRDATLEYAEQILPALAPEAVVVFDDINWSVGMRQAWQRLRRDPRFALTIDLRTMGLAVVSAQPNPPQTLRASYH